MSRQSHNSRKKHHTNLSDILDITYDYDSPSHYEYRHHNRKNYKSNYRRRNYDFIYSNFKFVVSPNDDHTNSILESNSIIAWDDVYSVIYQSPYEIECPICLDKIIYPNISPCSHVFCYHCISRYLHTIHSNLAPCPVCLQLKISRNDLRPLVIIPQKKYEKNDLITFQLLYRLKISNIISTVDDEVIKNLNEINLNKFKEIPSYHDKEAVYNRIIKVDHLHDLLVEEINKIDHAIEDYHSLFGENDESLPYLVEAKDNLQEKCQTPITEIKKKKNFTGFIPSKTTKHDIDSMFKNLNVNEEDFIFFYTEKNGQYIFLHPMNIKYMVNEFKNINRCGITIEGNIIDFEEYTLDGKMVKKYPQLSHLPLSCNIKFALITMDKTLKDRRNLNEFNKSVKEREKEIEKLRKIEMKRLEEESKRLNRSSRKNEYLYYSYGDYEPIVAPDISSEESFPSFSNEESKESPKEVTNSIWLSKSSKILESIKDEKEEKEEFPALTSPQKSKPSNHSPTPKESFSNIVKESPKNRESNIAKRNVQDSGKKKRKTRILLLNSY